MNKLDSMAAFVKVVDKGSFAAAAQALDLSATMVANHIKALETELGCRLLHRTTRQQQLSEAGQAYYQHCRRLLAQMAQAEAEVRELRGQANGVLRISAPQTFGSHALAPALADFLQTQTGVEVQLSLSNLRVDLLQEQYDAAIRIGQMPESGLIARPLQPYAMCLCASPDYLQRKGLPRHVAELATHDCLFFQHHAPLRSWRFLADEGEQSIQPAGRLSINNGAALREAALAGAGIILQPVLLVKADLVAGRLIRLLPQFELPGQPMSLVYLADRHMPQKLRVFIDFMLARWGAVPR